MVKASRVLLFAIALVALLAACRLDAGLAESGGEGSSGVGIPAPTEQPAASAEAAASSEAGAELSGILATKDLGVGANRISFLLVSPRALVKVPSATVKSVNLSAPDAVVETSTAEFFLWPFGSRGNYATELTFDQPGEWRLDVEVTEEDGSISMAQIPLTIGERSATPSFGDGPPSADNKTINDVGSLAELSTSSMPDADLYQQTVADALAEAKPLLVVFASPALCTSPTCGPQVETVEGLKDLYKDRASFIHVEVYDNPSEIQGDLDRARYAPMVDEWGLSAQTGYLNESWVFIFGADGTVTSKFQGYASIEELTKALDAVL